MRHKNEKKILETAFFCVYYKAGKEWYFLVFCLENNRLWTRVPGTGRSPWQKLYIISTKDAIFFFDFYAQKKVELCKRKSVTPDIPEHEFEN